MGPIRRGAAAVLLAFSILCSPGASGASPPFKIVPPHATVFDKTLGEWGALWWQWAVAIPDNPPNQRNPILDTTGDFAAEGQTSPVFFLAGTFGGGVNRSCSIPEGTFIFFPIIDNPCVSDRSAPVDLASLILQCRTATDGTKVLGCEIDGQAIPRDELFEHRETWAGFFLCLPPNNIVGNPPGCDGPAVHEGYYLMLEPLPKGDHQIHFWGSAGTPPIDFSLEVTYHLLVGGPPPADFFRRGDVNGDGRVNIADAISILVWRFLAGSPPACEDSSDTDDSGDVGLTDAVFLLNYLFVAGQGPFWPGPGLCGRDPTEDALAPCSGACAP